MADLEALIKQSIDSATETGDMPEAEGDTGDTGDEEAGDEGQEGAKGEDASADAGEGSGESDDAESDDSGSVDGGDDKGAADKSDKSDDSKIDVEEAVKLLEEAGIKPPKEGQRENRIPHSRVIRIIANGLKKGRAAYSAELKKTNDKDLAELAQLRVEKQGFDAAQRLIMSNPDEYVGKLATMFPNLYGRFAGIKDGQPTEDKTDKGDSKPAPDLHFEDGTHGYSPAQLEKLLDWTATNSATVTRTALMKELEPRLKNVESREASREATVKQGRAIRVLEDRMTTLYGKLFTDHKDGEIAKEITKENALPRNQRRPIEDIVAAVLIPKMQLTLDQQREKILKEQTERREASDKTGTGKASVRTKPREEDDNSEMDTEAIIRREVDRAKARGLR